MTTENQIHVHQSKSLKWDNGRVTVRTKNLGTRTSPVEQAVLCSKMFGNVCSF